MIILDLTTCKLIKDKKTYNLGYVQIKLLSLLSNNQVCTTNDVARFVYGLNKFDDYDINNIHNLTKINLYRLKRKCGLDIIIRPRIGYMLINNIKVRW